MSDPDLIAAAARAFDHSGLELVQHLPDDDVYRSGPEYGGALHVIPALWSTMSDDLLAALRVRRQASTTGGCPACGAVLALGTATMTHADDCLACDDLLSPPLIAWSRAVGRYARGRRLVEAPTPPNGG